MNIIDMNTDLRFTIDFEKDFFCKLINNSVSVRKRRDIKLSQQKGEGTIQHQNQIIILQSFSQKFNNNINEKKQRHL